MTGRTPVVGVVTVTYNSSSVLPDFLDSIRSQRGVDLRIYAIDNNSSDDSVAQLEAAEIQSLHIVANDRNEGVAEANNQGILAALAEGCDWVLLLNNDTVFDGDLVAVLVDEAQRSGLSLLTPLIEGSDPPGTIWFQDGKYAPAQGFRTTHPGEGAPMASAPKSLTPTQFAPTCCLLVRSEVFSHIGLMDPDYFVYFDDVDFAIRANRAGIRYWLTPRVTLLHKASTLTGGPESPFAIKWGSRNWVLITRKNHRGVGRLWCYAVIYVRSFARFASRRGTRAEYALRLSSFREALTTPLHPVPYPPSSRGDE